MSSWVKDILSIMDNKDQPLINKLYYNGKINPVFDIYVFLVFTVTLGIRWHCGYSYNLMIQSPSINLLLPEVLYTFLSMEKTNQNYSLCC